MIPHLTAAGCRVIAPDLPGYGKSDKPASLDDYSYESQVEWFGQWLTQNGFTNMTFFGQDWGGLIGLRLVVNHEERFDRVVISNTGLPYNPDVPESIIKNIEDFRANAPTPSLPQMQKAIGQMPGEQAVKFAYWQKFCWENENMPIGFMMSMMMEKTAKPLQALKFLMHSLVCIHHYRPLLPRLMTHPFLIQVIRWVHEPCRAMCQPYPHLLRWRNRKRRGIFLKNLKNLSCVPSPITTRSLRAVRSSS
jgi:pimeloyl-ACP methyl ester carboxylesterase